MDNYYNSIPLTQYLLKHNTNVVGTLRKSRRENPKEIMNAKLAKGNVVHAQKGNIHVLKWKDKRDVCMISTKHNLNFVSVTDRFGRSKLKPTMTSQYLTITIICLV